MMRITCPTLCVLENALMLEGRVLDSYSFQFSCEVWCERLQSTPFQNVDFCRIEELCPVGGLILQIYTRERKDLLFDPLVVLVV
ncbi:hypothetical protein Nepgr_025129 [Nepenthes gracilis]|uniref:Uncharacterized protein n=1 Tax=Nepenthes gracilis TaxID=150966 RepID=A0AAD3T771_NEPGR|nr:hypothetical protein Nepgr_025129 [Nepenthes gracilis]